MKLVEWRPRDASVVLAARRIISKAEGFLGEASGDGMENVKIKELPVLDGTDKVFQCLNSRFPDLVFLRRMSQFMFMSQS